MNLRLANGKTVEVSQGEVSEFITQTLIPNAYWRYSGQLTEEEVMRFLKGEATRDDLKRIARYILTYFENLAFTAYLFDKADGEPDRTKEFNMPAITKLRELYKGVTNADRNPADLAENYIEEDAAERAYAEKQVRLPGIVNEMENICLEIGADPL